MRHKRIPLQLAPCWQAQQRGQEQTGWETLIVLPISYLETGLLQLLAQTYWLGGMEEDCSAAVPAL